MKTSSIIVSSILLAMASGCATRPPLEHDVRMVPTDRVYISSKNNGDATIQVTRDKGVLGSGCYIAVYLDGNKVAALGTGERFIFRVNSGRHIIGAWQTGAGLCGIRDGRDRKEADATISRGELRKYRITINADLSITPTTI